LLVSLRSLIILFKQELFVILLYLVPVINVHLNYSRQFLVWML
jgi:nitrate reductase NapE component